LERFGVEKVSMTTIVLGILQLTDTVSTAKASFSNIGMDVRLGDFVLSIAFEGRNVEAVLD
jgi:hypothetical protein